MDKKSRIFVAGHRGLVGSAITRNLQEKGYENLITRTSSELDLRDSDATDAFFAEARPEYVFLAAAKVGGIVANNTYRGEFLYDNLMIQNNVIESARRHGVKKLLFLGSTCIYPRECPQPMKEEYLLTAPLEYTNEPYAIAKIAGLKLCESYNLQYGTNFISVMPTNLYGPNDNFDLEKSHVLPALMRKLHLGKALEEGDEKAVRADLDRLPVEGVDGSADWARILEVLAKHGVRYDSESTRNTTTRNATSRDASTQNPSTRKTSTRTENPSGADPSSTGAGDPSTRKPVSVEIWGSGRPMREFLWSEDMADACVFIMERVDFDDIVRINETGREVRNVHLNIGTGEEVSIRELAGLIGGTVGFGGRLRFNAEKPDGTLRKLTDPGRLQGLGWRHRVGLEEGVRRMYGWYVGESGTQPPIKHPPGQATHPPETR